jgi:hypothetical protein
VAQSLRSDSTLESRTAPGNADWMELRTSLAFIKKRSLLLVVSLVLALLDLFLEIH